MYDIRKRDYGEVAKSNKIYVSNLSASTTEDELRKLFQGFGSVSDIALKQKETITFAFIEFSSQSEAQAAIKDMNGKTVAGLEIKVQFARGGDRRNNFADRGRGRSGDRGGYQNRNYEGGDRRTNDRPRGCFNCGEEGHMIKDCTKPRKPRQFSGSGSGSGAPREREGERRTSRDHNQDKGGHGGNSSKSDRQKRKRSRSRSNDNKGAKRNRDSS